jgi:uncharacterized membrane-anchored protein
VTRPNCPGRSALHLPDRKRLKLIRLVNTMRVSLVTFVVSLLVVGLIRVWNAIIQYFDHHYLAYGRGLLAALLSAAWAVATSAGLIMLGLLP